MRRSKLLIFFLVITLSLTSVTFADTLKYGSRGAEVTKLQEQLKKLGYFSGKATGYFGSATKTAVKKFQASKGVAVDGIVGNQTSKILFNSGTSSRSALSREQLKKVQTALKNQGLYKGKIDGIFGKLTNSAVKQFQQKNGLSATGTIDAATEAKITALAASAVPSRGAASAAKTAAGKNAKIEMLDWWKEANKVFSIGTTAKVTDVGTGKSFKIVRTYGGNHADCEAATSEDSKIIKSIWGGNWSWARRPIIIELNGRRLAASMAAMPHAGVDSQPANKILNKRSQGYGRGYNLDKIKNNGMDGVFDVHFLNSRTHGTNRVDANHQKAVRKAASSEV
ncbi:MAG TPA: peptidoglycan-binding protein [Bacillota bacterium]|nr:peptidoglycan-binding protein [Bacillota bacterium]HPL99279.1 peptidoglycan-binding protein [Bacillota bacterium]